MTSIRCYTLDLRDEPQAIAEYERIHRPGGVYAEVIQDLRARGFEDMTIWRTGNRLFMIAHIEPREAVAPNSADQEVLDRWQSLTQGLQQALAGHGPQPEWIEMQCVFQLREHLGK